MAKLKIRGCLEMPPQELEIRNIQRIQVVKPIDPGALRCGPLAAFSWRTCASTVWPSVETLA